MGMGKSGCLGWWRWRTEELMRGEAEGRGGEIWEGVLLHERE